MSPPRATARLFWGTAATVIVADLVSKLLAERFLMPRYVPHRVMSESRLIDVIKLEAESVDPAALPEAMKGCGAVDAPEFVEHVRRCRR